MERKLLLKEMYKLTDEEIFAKSETGQEAIFNYLEEQGAVDANGYFVLSKELEQNFFFQCESPVWNKMMNSPHQQLFGLRRSVRYVNEPFCYGKFIAIRYVYSGEVEIDTLHTSFVLKKNDIFFMNARQILKQRLLHDNDIAFTLILEKEYLINHLLQNLEGVKLVSDFIVSYITDTQNPEYYIIFHGDHNDNLPRIMENIILEYIDPTECGDVLLKNYLQILFIQMLYSRIECTKNSRRFRNLCFAQMIDYIRKNYKNVTLDELADRFGYNSKYISRKIKECTGLNFKEYIIDKKLEHAKLLLLSDSYSVAEIIEDSGFSNATFFYQKFKKKFGITPAEYRQLKK